MGFCLGMLLFVSLILILINSCDAIVIRYEDSVLAANYTYGFTTYQHDAFEAALTVTQRITMTDGDKDNCFNFSDYDGDNITWIELVYYFDTTDTSTSDAYNLDTFQIWWKPQSVPATNVTFEYSETSSTSNPNYQPLVYVQGDTSGTSYLRASSLSGFEFVRQIHLYLGWKLNSGTFDGQIQMCDVEIYGKRTTQEPSMSPTFVPSTDPTPAPSDDPTHTPTLRPTVEPSVDPTMNPTMSPTYRGVYSKTDNFSVELYSTNIYALALRNMTYSNYKLPATSRSNNPPYKAAAILSWGDIDASIEFMSGGDCDGVDLSTSEIEYATYWDPVNNDLKEPPDWFNCSGTWFLKTSGRLADWQTTYGRIEVWEVDDFGRQWQQWEFEFQWDDKICEISDGVNCSYLSLTDNNTNTAYFEFTMPKLSGDARYAPLIVVWYDVLDIGYAVQPPLGYKFSNFTVESVSTDCCDGSVSLASAITVLQGPLIAIAILFGLFSGMVVISCALQTTRQSRYEYMLDTRQLRTTFMHFPQTLIAPPNELISKSRFDCKRHGLWLFIVLFARLVYMFVFTITAFFILFEAINLKPYDTLDSYSADALARDVVLMNMSRSVEIWFNNETARLEERVTFRQEECLGEFINVTDAAWLAGAAAQYNNHTAQMQYPLSFVSININTSDELFLVSDGHPCTTGSTDVTVITSDPLSTVTYFSNGTFRNQSTYYANEFDTSWSNFSILQEYLTDSCDALSYCSAWSFTNTQNETEASFELLVDLADDEIDETLSGVCFSQIDIDADLYALSESFSEDYFENYTASLESEYLDDYTSDVDTMYGQLEGLWTVIQGLDSSGAQDNLNYTFTVIMNNDPTVEDGYDIEFDMSHFGFGYDSSTDSTDIQTDWLIIVSCPGCPEGNFTSPYLQDIYDNLFSYNSSNLTDYFNFTTNINISNFLDLSTALTQLPDLPQIDIPLNLEYLFDIVDLENIWDLLFGLGLTIDIMLFIYRWYRTAGMVARIVRGKDVEIGLIYLLVDGEEQSRPRCCYGVNICDKLLNCTIYCHDFFFHLHYNVWKMIFWFWYLFRLFLFALIVYVLYAFCEQFFSVRFFDELGLFNLMTVALGAQRVLRNQFLSTSAVAYNKITLSAMSDTMTEYAGLLNDDAMTRNQEELDRVEEWNFYFGNVWAVYQASVREIEIDSYSWNVFPTNAYTLDDDISVLFNGIDSSGEWSPYNVETEWDNAIADNITFSIVMDFSDIYMTESLNVYWRVSQLQFVWNWYLDNSVNISVGDYIGWTLETMSETSVNWQEPISNTYQGKYFAKSYSVNDELLSVDVSWNATDTIKLRINFTNVGGWQDAYSLNSLSVWGHAPYSKIDAPIVEFYYWAFDAAEYQSELLYCPIITPVFGIMYRGFVRSWLTVALLNFHKPYIKAVRHIVLSPFYILFIGIVILFLAYLLAYMMEWTLKKVNLFRENPYTRVPLVTTQYEHYDPSLHEKEPSRSYDFTQNHTLYDSLQKVGTMGMGLPRTPNTMDMDMNIDAETGGNGGVDEQTGVDMNRNKIEMEMTAVDDGEDGNFNSHYTEAYDAPPDPTVQVQDSSASKSVSAKPNRKKVAFVT